jgi:phosphopantothenoylcysteine decarboxylase
MQNEKIILIAVTGSIAAFKTCELVRSLVKKQFPVQVIMTKNATEFIGKITFEALTNREVRIEEYDKGMAHIEMKNLASVFAIVPASANSLGKFANGIADDLVSSTYLANTSPVILAPAMNPGMYSNKAVQRNLTKLKEDGVLILDPTEGVVICGDEGKGKLADISLIEEKIIEIHLANS